MGEKLELERQRIEKLELEKQRIEKLKLERNKKKELELERQRIEKLELEKQRIEKLELEKILQNNHVAAKLQNIENEMLKQEKRKVREYLIKEQKDMKKDVEITAQMLRDAQGEDGNIDLETRKRLS